MSIELRSRDGQRIHAVMHEAVGDTIGVLQLVHGLGEHSGRYERFARAANARGIAVWIHDHRGHGEHAILRGFFGESRGWDLVVEDVRTVNEALRARHGDRRVVILGHSMGSFIAQTYMLHYGSGLAGAVLSGSTWPSRAKLLPAMALARIEAMRHGKRGNSALLDKLGFGAMNRRFQPARTPYDWLSRDEHEVDKYIGDPLCGGPFSCGLWQDMLGGMFGLGSDTALNRIPSDLPILISGGADDPVGGEHGMTRLMVHYAQTGHSRMKLRIFEGGRHEMLNEINREEVTTEWLDWIEAQLRR